MACLDEGPTGRGKSVERLDSAVEKRAKRGTVERGREGERQKETERDGGGDRDRDREKGGPRRRERDGEGGRGRERE